MKLFSYFAFQLIIISLCISSTGWSQWIQQGSKLFPGNSIGSTIFHGYSVALSSDGNTAIVGVLVTMQMPELRGSILEALAVFGP